MSYRWLLIFTCFSIGACETPVEPLLPDAHSRLVVYSFFNPEQSWEVNLSESNFILDMEVISAIEEAEVAILQGNKVIERLKNVGKGVYVGETIPEPLVEYSIEVNTPSYGEVFATDHIPERVPIYSFSISDTLTKVNVDEYGYPAQLVFNDPAAVANYYAVEVIIKDCKESCTEDIFEGKPGYLITEDLDVNTSGNNDITIGGPSVINGNLVLFFDDKKFNGSGYKLNFFIVPVNIDFSIHHNYEVYLVLKSLSKSYYDYLVTSQFQEEIEESNNLAEPVQVANNISNGLGVFAGFNFTTKKASIPE